MEAAQCGVRAAGRRGCLEAGINRTCQVALDHKREGDSRFPVWRIVWTLVLQARAENPAVTVDLGGGVPLCKVCVLVGVCLTCLDFVSSLGKSELEKR